MKLILCHHGLLSIVNGTTPMPDATMDPAGYLDWYDKDQEALLQIIFLLKVKGQNCMHDMSTSKACWDKLANQYQGKGDQ